jgi:predicted metal-dependent enzyme (double-stranded beta helix superfamily)
MPNVPSKLRDCIAALDRLLAEQVDEGRILAEGRDILAELIAADDWLNDSYACPQSDHYSQYLLYLDPNQRFSISSFVWTGGQSTPIHDHTVWGLIGVLRGSELSQSYQLDDRGAPIIEGAACRLVPGEVSAVSPSIGDIHRVSNAFADQVSVSIHTYGADICALDRSVIHPDGRRSVFRSAYANGADTPSFRL